MPFVLLTLNVGDYFRADDFADQSPGNLSSSSLRRKLFLDGNGSISDSLPPASPRSLASSAPTSLEVFYSIDLSPVQCRSPVQTPSSVRSVLKSDWLVSYGYNWTLVPILHLINSCLLGFIFHKDYIGSHFRYSGMILVRLYNFACRNIWDNQIYHVSQGILV